MRSVFDLTDGLWRLSILPVELVLRSLLDYALLLVALRLSRKRELGQFTIFDFASRGVAETRRLARAHRSRGRGHER